MQLFLLTLCVLSSVLQAQDIQLYSELERFGPYGNAVSQDRDPTPREILSPAVPRNGHLTVHAVVTAPAGTNYFIYIAANPPDTLETHLYREYFTPCGAEYCPDWLMELRQPAFGAIPESRERLPLQTTRSYLLDIYVPKDVPPRRVRIEALLKTGTWLVAPMEVRVISPVIPDMSRIAHQDDIADLTAPSSDTALRQMLRFEAGLPPDLPKALLRGRDFIQRNAAEDFALAALLKPRFWKPLRIEPYGAEWYLAVRDMIYRRIMQAY